MQIVLIERGKIDYVTWPGKPAPGRLPLTDISSVDARKFRRTLLLRRQDGKTVKVRNVSNVEELGSRISLLLNDIRVQAEQGVSNDVAEAGSVVSTQAPSSSQKADAAAQLEAIKNLPEATRTQAERAAAITSGGVAAVSAVTVAGGMASSGISQLLGIVGVLLGLLASLIFISVITLRPTRVEGGDEDNVNERSIALAEAREKDRTSAKLRSTLAKATGGLAGLALFSSLLVTTGATIEEKQEPETLLITDAGKSVLNEFCDGRAPSRGTVNPDSLSSAYVEITFEKGECTPGAKTVIRLPIKELEGIREN